MSKQDAFPVGLATRGSPVRAPSISLVVMPLGAFGPLSSGPRCERHGMLMVAGGPCLRCAKEDASRTTRQTLSIVAVVSLGILLTLVGARVFVVGRELAAASPPASTGQAPSGESRLVVYTTSSCPYCRKAKASLDEQHIAYVERNVDSDEQAREEWSKLGGRGVPLFAIDGAVVQRGYDPTGGNLTRALAERGMR